MTWQAYLLIAGVVLMLIASTWAGLRGPKVKAADLQGLKAQTRKRGPFKRDTCPYCGLVGIIVRQDGEPSARYHRCAEGDAFFLGDSPKSVCAFCGLSGGEHRLDCRREESRRWQDEPGMCVSEFDAEGSRNSGETDEPEQAA